MKDCAVLYAVEHEREITEAEDGAFLYEYQRALLLALKEAGLLEEWQCLRAEARLRERTRAPGAHAAAEKP